MPHAAGVLQRRIRQKGSAMMAPNGTALFLGLWLAAFVFFLIPARLGRLRRGGFAALAALLGIFVVPPLLDSVTGRIQPASFRATMDHCTRGMRGQVQPTVVMNVCDTPIVVGLCLSDEMNPDTCRQTATIAPGESAQFDPKGQSLASRPMNPRGLTVVACRPGDRASRTTAADAMTVQGVCLP